MNSSIYLLDVNVLVALLTEDHVHSALVTSWFATPGLHWGLCALTEGGFLRNATAQRTGQVSMSEATGLLNAMREYDGYRYVAIDADFATLCGPFSARLFGTKQVTDAYLLGVAVRNDMVLVTLDRGLTHLAGAEFSKNLLVLRGPRQG